MKQRKYEDPMTDDTRIALLENNLGHINNALERLERKIDTGFLEIKDLNNKIDSKFEALDKKFDSKLDGVNTKLWTLFFWVTAGFATILGVIAKANHWFN